MSLTIKHIKSPRELYLHYEGQYNAQKSYIELDCCSEILSAEVDAEIGNAVPVDVYNGHTLRWPIPVLSVSRCNNLLDDIAPIARRIIRGYKSKWDGSNNMAIYTDNAKRLAEEVSEMCFMAEGLSIMTSEEYMEDSDWMPTAETTDEEIKMKAYYDDEVHLLTDDLTEYLINYRNNLK